MKKKGVTLVETVVSLMILMMVITMFVTIVKDYNININTRRIKERLSRLSYCVMNELKYNCTKEEIMLQSSNNKIGLKNYENILDDLKNRSLLELDRGNGVEIFFNNNTNDSLKIKVTIYEEGFIEEREFVKWR
ncbi:Uncharacterised protein [uncultured Clostridium sp.]|uniref:prepilin-type N-terminal cleavage/methylation domain-containing protein n=1 Tax=uncultured Clostridium sp. TaxID=59620 RepID=UPI000820CB0A|nr:hypothetical protein [uncultured Clostridium sp.]SCJ54661.1 Uncharacterised protein [uncultured Clostridium sp.]